MAELIGGSSVSIVIYDSAITAMNMPGGMVNTYFKDKGSKAAAFAKEMAPKRTGELARSVRREKVQWSRTRVHVRVSARAKHAIWVIKGTGPWISVDDTAEGFFYMPRRKNSPHYRRYYFDVRGQDPNNFLERAAAAAARSPYMRGARLVGNPFG